MKDEINNIIKNIRNDENFIDLASYELKNKNFEAKIFLKDDKVCICGINIIYDVLKSFNLNGSFNYNDGEIAEKGIIGSIFGDAYNILLCERTILNILSFMSSISSKTNKINEKILDLGFKTKIAATRKTIPGLNKIQKYAVMIGGGDTHRFNLYNTIMIKDNHISLYGGIKNSIEAVSKFKSFTQKLEIEVNNLNMALEALNYNVDIIMLDNFNSYEAKETAKKLKSLNNNILIEVSGGISENNYLEFLSNDIDIISMGILTTEINYIDFSLKI
ncbi:nicotinate-nucleotide pyrophosphorylase [carboxylating] [Oceanotoga teriensis]|uniref:nicotinate-nucleotide diphosphorylase (carboxylating) n=1 Tax=Oceanotoga teriensis TaxID=515440 RepID=A0AA45HJ14_9BACT|nr:carboxylating nicotinate-nucleotide diphosphorylase [Oceanotoga teriensis]PWJ95303.1 nicotinate-nucleotide pyrophosphorylase [carboxylating] [Oceanotoga teriensis]